MSSSVSPWSRRRSEWPTIAHVARPADHRRRDLAGVGARRLGVDVLGADRDVGAGQRVARRPRGDTNGGQMTRVTPGTSVAAAMARASGPASRGRRVHLPVAGDDHGSHGAHHQVAPACPRGPAARAPRPRRASRALACGSNARWTRARLAPGGRELAEASPRERARRSPRDGAARAAAGRPARPSASSSLDRRAAGAALAATDRREVGASRR